MAGGRPTDYSKEILKQTEEYIDDCEDTSRKVRLPTIEGLAYYLHLNKDTIYEWRKIHPEFSELIEDLLAKQADRLVNKGLSGDYNPTIAKVLLTKHGYREGIEQTGKDGEPLMNDDNKKKAKSLISTFLNRRDS